ncbi:hypothetical protein MF271_22375 (plasmid) [Deinococcus sp. KNUC1210]|uniref:hypothetical protein n=1 Tax=Deinococcus sp. KNUC1210 TaxID=2917691 RepID=UPI001EF0BD2B|nr:hypothetical protein [Deinococcus sp. KNUC1210]ULH18219.1 hypothetical protein MF271_22375 [Deinococcus sp. KNUC1210]
MTLPHRPGTDQRLLAGLIGALTVTLLNEGARQVLPHAPRIDVIGERGLTRVFRVVGCVPPRGEALYWSTLAADLVSNALLYSVIGLGDPAHVGQRGAAVGLAAGLGAALLPPRLGLGHSPGERWPVTPVLTATWYLAGGLATALTLSSMQRWNRRSAPARV